MENLIDILRQFDEAEGLPAFPKLDLKEYKYVVDCNESEINPRLQVALDVIDVITSEDRTKHVSFLRSKKSHRSKMGIFNGIVEDILKVSFEISSSIEVSTFKYSQQYITKVKKLDSNYLCDKSNGYFHLILNTKSLSNLDVNKENKIQKLIEDLNNTEINDTHIEKAIKLFFMVHLITIALDKLLLDLGLIIDELNDSTGMNMLKCLISTISISLLKKLSTTSNPLIPGNNCKISIISINIPTNYNDKLVLIPLEVDQNLKVKLQDELGTFIGDVVLKVKHSTFQKTISRLTDLSLLCFGVASTEELSIRLNTNLRYNFPDWNEFNNLINRLSHCKTRSSKDVILRANIPNESQLSIVKIKNIILIILSSIISPPINRNINSLISRSIIQSKLVKYIGYVHNDEKESAESTHKRKFSEIDDSKGNKLFDYDVIKNSIRDRLIDIILKNRNYLIDLNVEEFSLKHITGVSNMFNAYYFYLLRYVDKDSKIEIIKDENAEVVYPLSNLQTLLPIIKLILNLVENGQIVHKRIPFDPILLCSLLLFLNTMFDQWSKNKFEYLNMKSSKSKALVNDGTLYYLISDVESINRRCNALKDLLTIGLHLSYSIFKNDNWTTNIFRNRLYYIDTSTVLKGNQSISFYRISTSMIKMSKFILLKFIKQVFHYKNSKNVNSNINKLENNFNSKFVEDDIDIDKLNTKDTVEFIEFLIANDDRKHNTYDISLVELRDCINIIHAITASTEFKKQSCNYFYNEPPKIAPFISLKSENNIICQDCEAGLYKDLISIAKLMTYLSDSFSNNDLLKIEKDSKLETYERIVQRCLLDIVSLWTHLLTFSNNAKYGSVMGFPSEISMSSYMNVVNVKELEKLCIIILYNSLSNLTKLRNNSLEDLLKSKTPMTIFFGHTLCWRINLLIETFSVIELLYQITHRYNIIINKRYNSGNEKITTEVGLVFESKITIYDLNTLIFHSFLTIPVILLISQSLIEDIHFKSMNNIDDDRKNLEIVIKKSPFIILYYCLLRFFARFFIPLLIKDSCKIAVDLLYFLENHIPSQEVTNPNNIHSVTINGLKNGSFDFPHLSSTICEEIFKIQRACNLEIIKCDKLHCKHSNNNSKTDIDFDYLNYQQRYENSSFLSFKNNSSNSLDERENKDYFPNFILLIFDIFSAYLCLLYKRKLPLNSVECNVSDFKEFYKTLSKDSHNNFNLDRSFLTFYSKLEKVLLEPIKEKTFGLKCYLFLFNISSISKFRLFFSNYNYINLFISPSIFADVIVNPKDDIETDLSTQSKVSTERKLSMMYLKFISRLMMDSFTRFKIDANSITMDNEYIGTNIIPLDTPISFYLISLMVNSIYGFKEEFHNKFIKSGSINLEVCYHKLRVTENCMKLLLVGGFLEWDVKDENSIKLLHNKENSNLIYFSGNKLLFFSTSFIFRLDPKMSIEKEFNLINENQNISCNSIIIWIIYVILQLSEMKLYLYNNKTNANKYKDLVMHMNEVINSSVIILQRYIKYIGVAYQQLSISKLNGSITETEMNMFLNGDIVRQLCKCAFWEYKLIKPIAELLISPSNYLLNNIILKNDNLLDFFDPYLVNALINTPTELSSDNYIADIFNDHFKVMYNSNLRFYQYYYRIQNLIGTISNNNSKNEKYSTVFEYLYGRREEMQMDNYSTKSRNFIDCLCSDDRLSSINKIENLNLNLSFEVNKEANYFFKQSLSKYEEYLYNNHANNDKNIKSKTAKHTYSISCMDFIDDVSLLKPEFNGLVVSSLQHPGYNMISYISSSMLNYVKHLFLMLLPNYIELANKHIVFINQCNSNFLNRYNQITSLLSLINSSLEFIPNNSNFFIRYFNLNLHDKHDSIENNIGNNSMYVNNFKVLMSLFNTVLFLCLGDTLETKEGHKDVTDSAFSSRSKYLRLLVTFNDCITSNIYATNNYTLIKKKEYQSNFESYIYFIPLNGYFKALESSFNEHNDLEKAKPLPKLLNHAFEKMNFIFWIIYDNDNTNEFKMNLINEFFEEDYLKRKGSIELKCNDGSVVCDKTILSIFSEVMKGYFDGNFLERNSNVIEIVDIELKDILFYILWSMITIFAENNQNHNENSAFLKSLNKSYKMMISNNNFSNKEALFIGFNKSVTITDTILRLINFGERFHIDILKNELLIVILINLGVIQFEENDIIDKSNQDKLNIIISVLYLKWYRQRNLEFRKSKEYKIIMPWNGILKENNNDLIMEFGGLNGTVDYKYKDNEQEIIIRSIIDVNTMEYIAHVQQLKIMYNCGDLIDILCTSSRKFVLQDENNHEYYIRNNNDALRQIEFGKDYIV